MLLVVLGIAFASCVGPRTTAGDAPHDEAADDITFCVEPALAFPGVGISIPELRIEGEIRYARITVRAGTGEGQSLGRMEVRPTVPGPVTLHNLSWRYARDVTGEIVAEDVHGNTRRHEWRVH